MYYQFRVEKSQDIRLELLFWKKFVKYTKYRRGTDVLKILLKIDRLNRDFGRF